MQLLFRQYLRHLFDLGYFERSRFRQFYFAALDANGSTMQDFSQVVLTMNSSLESMELILNADVPNLQLLVICADLSLELTTMIGAFRMRELIVSTKQYAQISHLSGCFTYLRMLQNEFLALLNCINLFTEMEAAMIATGILIPVDW